MFRRSMTVTTILVTSLLVYAPAHAAPTRVERLKPQVVQLDRDGAEVAPKGRPQNRLASSTLPKATWPAPQSERVHIGGTSNRTDGKGAKAGDLPVWLDAVAGTASADMSVQVIDRAKLPSALRDGMLVRIGALATTTQVQVAIDYNAFRYASGGDWASRLRLWQVPECALSSPATSGCQLTALPTTNDVVAGTASAKIDAAATGTPGQARTKAELAGNQAPPNTSGTLVMLAAAASGSSGDFSATSLAPSSTWSAGGSSGAFNWNYPLRVPPSAGGPAPSVQLSYSSSSVDGRSEATNNQPSWLGEGFDFEPGYIERRYVQCVDDMKNGAVNTAKTADQCWRSENATMSLNGRGGELVFETGKGWHSRNEDGSKIEKLTGAANGDNNGEYWKITTSDGVQYFFGMHQLPGQSSTTDSANTVRVYGNHSGEPCHASSFASAHCTQAWRWNLDYVVDPRGNTVSYWYAKEWQRYAANQTDTNVVGYVRASALTRIDYGTYWRTTAEHGVTEQSVNATAQVQFTTADRCLTSCVSGGNPVKENWPDTPHDQDCKMTATSCPSQYAPTFWTTKRLSKITNRVWDTTKPTPNWQDVESWTLTHAFPSPGDGTHAGLWLDSIVHSGLVGGTTSSAPVTFEPVSLPNRVLTGHNTTNNWLRIANITLETGARLHIDHSLPECSDSNKPANAHTNTMRCYPVLVSDPNDPDGSTLLTEWWHKYVVTHIAEDDVPLADGHQSVSKHSWYEYVGAPAWHYADDDGLSKPDRKTWSQFRGYATVKTRVGNNPAEQSLTATTYLRGMHDDRLNPSGGTKAVTVGASLGSETVYDEDQFAGMIREQVVYKGEESKPLAKTVSVPWRSGPTASRTINGDTVTARYANTVTTYSSQALGVDESRGWRTSSVKQEFDSTYGTVNWAQDDGDLAVTGDEKCTTTTYNRNTVKNLVTTVKQSTTIAKVCGQAPVGVDDVIADQRYTYDGAASVDVTPVYGSVSKVEKLKDWVAGSGTVWQTISQSTVDSAGRPRTVTDIKGNVTTTAYTPAVGGPITRIATTSPAPFNWVSTVDINPYWGATVRSTDPNGKITGEVDYDPLGRVSKVWQLGLTKAANPATPSAEYSYVLSANRDTYPYVVSKTLNAKGQYLSAYQIMDGFFRARQNQTVSLSGDGSRVVTDTIYDSLGRAAVSYSPHAEPGQPSGSLWWEPEWSVPAVTKTLYDRASQPIASVFYATDGITNLVEKWRSSTAFEGDLTKSTPPSGGIATTTVNDIAGRATALRQHTTSAGVDGAYNETKYVFNRKDQLSKLVDAAGNEWVYTYDAKGRQQTTKDPDKGTTTSVYNDANELIKTTDANNKVLFHVYDQLGREKELRDDSATGALRAEWKYDTLYSGQTGFRGHLTQAIRYEPAGTANAYKWQVRSMTGRYQPGGVNIVIPAAETGLNATYAYSYSYSAHTGDQTSVTYPAVGDVPTETVTTDYDPVTSLPVRLDTNRIGQTGTMLAAWYTAYGQPTLTTRKVPGGVYVDDSVEFDVTTHRVTRTTIKPETGGGTVSDRRYTYDPAGNITSINDTPETGSADRQCFRYDRLTRLTSAWSPSSAACDTDPTTSGLGGPAPYWLDWTFDELGSRLTEVSHATAGDTTRAFTVPTTGGPNVVRPHAMTAMNTTAPGQSPVTQRYEYDNTGNTTCRPSSTATNTCPSGTGSQTLTWTPEGKLEKATAGGNTIETNIYDTSGARLVRRDATGTTIYLPGQEIRREGTVNKGTRYYTFGGQVSASRNSTGLTWLYNDHQGTQQLSVQADTQATSIRRQNPYGGPRGSQPAWANQKGFVGGDKDPTGLLTVGARQYDQVLGRFLSVDPVMDSSNPQSLQGYLYAGNNPVTYADPTGLCWLGPVCEAAQQTFATAWKEGVTFVGKKTGPVLHTIDTGLRGVDAYTEFVGGVPDMIWDDVQEDASAYLGTESDPTPIRLGWEWASGTGPKHRDFTDGSRMVSSLQQHGHVQDTRDIIAAGVRSGSLVAGGTGDQYKNKYSLTGDGTSEADKLKNALRKVYNDNFNPETSNMAGAFLGSYQLNFDIKSVDTESGTVTVQFTVTNDSTIYSATRTAPPIGYGPWWRDNIGVPLNDRFKTGPMSKKSQTIVWTETIRIGPNWNPSQSTLDKMS